MTIYNVVIKGVSIGITHSKIIAEEWFLESKAPLRDKQILIYTSK